MRTLLLLAISLVGFYSSQSRAEIPAQSILAPFPVAHGVATAAPQLVGVARAIYHVPAQGGCGVQTGCGSPCGQIGGACGMYQNQMGCGCRHHGHRIHQCHYNTPCSRMCCGYYAQLQAYYRRFQSSSFFLATPFFSFGFSNTKGF